MPWNEVTSMDERTQFIADVLRRALTIAELCDRYGISRKTGYKWIGRYQADGPAGLTERSHRPHQPAHQTAAEIVDALAEARRRHPSWGAKKLLKKLAEREPRWRWPARSTANDILDRLGLVRHRRQRRIPGHPGKPTTVAAAPNDLWCTDFKGQFKTRDGIYCYPLTTTDARSRFLLGCQGLYTTACADARPVFTRLFREYGLPLRMRSDNGVPFATTTLARLSKLSAWWVRLGILPDLIQPGKPQQNGSHERMHLTLKDETTRPPKGNLAAQQRRFNTFIQEFNHERPHEALDQEVPASQYTPSPRPMPSKIPRLEYPAHYELRLVSDNGGIRWNHHWVNVSQCCAGENIGLEETDNGVWDVYFGALKLGRLLEEHLRIEDRFGKLKRHDRS